MLIYYEILKYSTSANATRLLSRKIKRLSFRVDYWLTSSAASWRAAAGVEILPSICAN